MLLPYFIGGFVLFSAGLLLVLLGLVYIRSA